MRLPHIAPILLLSVPMLFGFTWFSPHFMIKVDNQINEKVTVFNDANIHALTHRIVPSHQSAAVDNEDKLSNPMTLTVTMNNADQIKVPVCTIGVTPMQKAPSVSVYNVTNMAHCVVSSTENGVNVTVKPGEKPITRLALYLKNNTDAHVRFNVLSAKEDNLAALTHLNHLTLNPHAQDRVMLTGLSTALGNVGAGGSLQLAVNQVLTDGNAIQLCRAGYTQNAEDRRVAYLSNLHFHAGSKEGPAYRCQLLAESERYTLSIHPRV